ncbi:MAG TPA: hypothetical protein VNH64_00290 [Parvularculaceae bacterium]|nr:hypothetical protein [Parvularculaceae bacterium]
MTLEAIYYASQIFVALALVVSLVFAAIQIRHATQAARAQTNQSIANSWLMTAGVVADHITAFNAGLASARDGFDDISADDRMTFVVIIHAYFRHYENIFLQAERGYIDRRMWDSWSEHMRIVAAFPGAQRWWRMRSRGFAPEFQRVVEAAVANAPSVAQ